MIKSAHPPLANHMDDPTPPQITFQDARMYAQLCAHALNAAPALDTVPVPARHALSAPLVKNFADTKCPYYRYASLAAAAARTRTRTVRRCVSAPDGPTGPPSCTRTCARARALHRGARAVVCQARAQQAAQDV